MTDARIVRTRAALHDSILALATHKPSGEISVSELAAHAQINRVTFYKHFASPGEALATALSIELDEARKRDGHHPPHIDAYTWYVHALVNQIEARRQLYTIAFRERVEGTVPLMLTRNLNDVAAAYLTKRRKKKPTVPDVDIDVAAAFIAAGTMSAIWVWTLEGDVHQERLFENLHHVLPEWFHAERKTD
ncbi:TetR/AcrR family transcriptional regulator [Leucobacter denitrificans]|uniref:TetR/AcrR family transcriptional regulator n=1 Tax=Leucobacter denitrificans TaxID=683042 RepID=A0A7G9S6Y1_9MICO|nr:TetR/AcrR family transcriptional regulator [Leucobacter denitrificans]QNN63606.1 TetR/AcrR family transcriptional regulator [Leucobacter denitrificans]